MKLKVFTRTVLSAILVVCGSLSVAVEPDVGAGMEHTVVLKSDGSVWSWGENRSGQLGNGTSVSSVHPVQVSLAQNIIAISVGGYHALALTDDGTVWAWGNNREGQVGDGTTVNALTPVMVDGLSNVISIATGMYHSMALLSDGSVWGWGGNSNGQLGNASLLSRSAPALVELPSAASEIAAGYWDSYALDASGKIWLWGFNAYAEPLVPSAAPIFELPVLFGGSWSDVKSGSQTSREIVLPDDTVVVVAKGMDHSVMLRPDGVVLESVGETGDSDLGSGNGGISSAREVKWTGAVSMSLLPAQAVADGAVWRIDDRWYASGDTAYLVEGRYTLAFSAANGWAAPSVMTVDVVRGQNTALNALFSAQPGSLAIGLTPSVAAAKWRIKGGDWNSSDQVLSGLTPGEYVVEYSALPGWRMPDENVFVVQANTKTSANVVFEQKTSSLIVNMGPDEVVPLGAKWRLGHGRWFDAGMSIVDLLPGTYEIEFSPVEGWDAPDSFSVSVSAIGVGVSVFYSPAGGTPVPVIVGEGVGPLNPVLDPPNPAPDEGDTSGGEDAPPENFFTAATEIDVDAIDAKVMSVGDNVEASIDYVGAASFYVLNARRGASYLFHSQSSGATQISFYDASGDLVQTFDAAARADDFRFMWVAPASDQYYVKVEFNDGWSTGGVQVNVVARGKSDDFNGDGESDVMGRDENDILSLLYMRDGSFSNKVSTQYQVDSSNTEQWALRLIDDFNGDHRADILWRAASGHTSVWLMTGSRLDDKSGLTSEYVGGLADGWDVIDSGDFNGDGRADILWAHSTSGQLAIWMMEGVEVTADSGLLSRQAGGSVGWRVDGVGDFNGDGRADILWRHKTTGRMAVWLMDGLTHTNGSGLVADHFVSQASHWQVAAVADFDADGRADILWRNARDGYLYIWFMSGAKVVRDDFVTNYVDAASTWELVQVGDFNGDGKADLLWQEADSKHLYAWFMNGLHPVGDMEATSDSATLSRWKVLGGVFDQKYENLEVRQ